MTGFIDKIITFYEMRAMALSILVANTEKALNEFATDRKRMANGQAEKLENFVKDLTTDINNMLTRFWFQKERKLRRNEQITDEDVKNLVDFANFVKTLTKDLRLLLAHFQSASGQTFEEKFDKEKGQMKAYVKKRLKEFDAALNGRDDTLKGRLSKSVGNILGCIRNPSRQWFFSSALNIKVAESSSENKSSKYT
jgi:hypothetical protein